MLSSLNICCIRKKSCIWTNSDFSILKHFHTDFIQIYRTLRSSCWKVVYKNGVLKSFDKFTGKDLSWSIFFNNVAGLRPGTLFKRLQHRFFSASFVKLYRTLSVAACERAYFSERTFCWLL